MTTVFKVLFSTAVASTVAAIALSSPPLAKASTTFSHHSRPTPNQLPEIESIAVPDINTPPREPATPVTPSNLPEFQEGTIDWHHQAITAIDFSPDGQYILTGGSDSNLRLWDRNSNLLGLPIGIDDYNADRIVGAAFLSDGQHIVSGHWSSWIYIWDLQGNVVHSFEAHDGWAIHKVEVSSNREIIGSVSRDGKVRFWNQQGEMLGESAASEEQIFQVAFHPNNQEATTTDQTGLIQRWSISGEPLGEAFRLHDHPDFHDEVVGVAYSPDGSALVLGDEFGQIHWVDLEGEPIRPPFFAHGSAPLDLAFRPAGARYAHILNITFSPDGNRYATTGSDGLLKLWDLEGNLLNSVVRRHRLPILDIAFGPEVAMAGDSSFGTIATAGSDSVLGLWDSQGTPLRLGFTQSPVQAVTEVLPESLTESPSSHTDEAHFIGVDYYDQQTLLISQWNLQEGMLGEITATTEKPIFSIAISPTTITTSHDDGSLSFWDHQGNLIREVSYPPGFSRASDRQSAEFWERIELADNGQTFISTNRHGMQLWDVEGNAIAAPIHLADNATLVGFDLADDGQTLALGIITDNRTGSIQLWSQEGQLLNQFNVSFNPYSKLSALSFSPDGDRLILGFEGGVLRQWTIGGEQIGSGVKAHRKAIASIQTSPDGQLMFTHDTDTLRLWQADAQPIHEPMDLPVSIGRNTPMRFISDQQGIVIVNNFTLHVWKLFHGLSEPLTASSRPASPLEAVRPDLP